MQLEAMTVIFWAVFLLVAGQSGKVDATIRTRAFYRNSNPDQVAEDIVGDPLIPTSSSSTSSPSPSSRSTSRSIRCAMECLEAFPNCTSFLLNSTTGQCIQASSPQPLVPELKAGHGDLYVSCDTQNGYQMYTFGSAAACLAAMETTRENYTDASWRCEELGGYLASVRSWDKLQLLSAAMGGNHSFWVGLDDMDEEGTFVWKEDGQVAFKANATSTAADMADVLMGGLWDHPREPNNFGGNEDCTQIKYSEYFKEMRLNDYKCFNKNKFVCEMPVQLV
ncbi:hypothetical protein EGW08_014074 [Elysia chlorotica]|uniref:C-type lectin domain-containing protein n=1 Tax=Elysia chlorotica TaxID=188477 RepID=A0A433T9A9_ELYCH|nr:hypothetical protein EGW08_014074 [Elysia chlorotica]